MNTNLMIAGTQFVELENNARGDDVRPWQVESDGHEGFLSRMDRLAAELIESHLSVIEQDLDSMEVHYSTNLLSGRSIKCEHEIE